MVLGMGPVSRLPCKSMRLPTADATCGDRLGLIKIPDLTNTMAHMTFPHSYYANRLCHGSITKPNAQ